MERDPYRTNCQVQPKYGHANTTKKYNKDQSPNKRPHPKVQNPQWGGLRGLYQATSSKPLHQQGFSQ